MLTSCHPSISAVPFPPLNVTVTQITSNNASVSWVPGFDGLSPLRSCTVQVFSTCIDSFKNRQPNLHIKKGCYDFIYVCLSSLLSTCELFET